MLNLGRLGMCFEYFLGTVFWGYPLGVDRNLLLRADEFSNLVGNSTSIYGNNSSSLNCKNLPAFEYCSTQSYVSFIQVEVGKGLASQCWNSDVPIDRCRFSRLSYTKIRTWALNSHFVAER